MMMSMMMYDEGMDDEYDDEKDNSDRLNSTPIIVSLHHRSLSHFIIINHYSGGA